MTDLQRQIKAQEVTENVIWQWRDQEKITPRVVDIVEDALRWAYTEGQRDKVTSLGKNGRLLAHNKTT